VKEIYGNLTRFNLVTRFNRGQFGQETDAVSVRKAKNIASEVDRKRTNKITRFFASSMGLPPSPAQ
jgi:hypothetical protein